MCLCLYVWRERERRKYERMKMSKYQVPENAHFIEFGLAVLLNLASPIPALLSSIIFPSSFHFHPLPFFIGF